MNSIRKNTTLIIAAMSLLILFASCTKTSNHEEISETKIVTSQTQESAETDEIVSAADHVEQEINSPATEDVEKIIEYAKKYISYDLELANYYYLNALNKYPENFDLWKSYVEDTLEYGDTDTLSNAYSNLDVAILNVDADYIQQIVEFREKIIDKQIELEFDEVSEGTETSSVDNFVVSCENFPLLLNDTSQSIDSISSKYEALSNVYYSIEESSVADSKFNEATALFNLLQSITELKAYGEYIASSTETFFDLIKLIDIFDSTYQSLQYAYGSLGFSLELIDAELKNIENVRDNIEMNAASALEKELTNKRPTLSDKNGEAVEQLNQYQLYIQELLQIVGNNVSFYEIINDELLWITTAFNNITVSREKAYQKWAYSVIVKAKSLDIKKSTSYDYQEFIKIDTSLLIPELYVLYNDLHDSLNKKLTDYDALIEYSVQIGLKSLEEF